MGDEDFRVSKVQVRANKVEILRLPIFTARLLKLRISLTSPSLLKLLVKPT